MVEEAKWNHKGRPGPSPVEQDVLCRTMCCTYEDVHPLNGILKTRWRVHDVRETKQALKVWAAISNTEF